MMQLLKLTVTTALAVSVLSACTLSNNKWSNFDNQSSQIKLQANQAGLVFYRADTGVNPTAVNIKVNGEYLSSLQVGGFAKTEICAKPTTFEAHYVAAKPATRLNVSLTEQSVHYYQIDATNVSVPQIKEVNAATAQEALKKLKHQAHTISRINETACAAN